MYRLRCSGQPFSQFNLDWNLDYVPFYWERLIADSIVNDRT